MKIIHLSDTHAQFPELSGDFEAVVFSGDFFPNHKHGPNESQETRKREVEYQTNWLKKNLSTMKKWLNDKPLLWCSGNHDFINPCEILNQNGITAIDLDNKVVQFGGLTWYGFPYIPLINDKWNWECNQQQLKQEVQNFLERLKDVQKFNELDVIVAHCPPLGILDSYKGQNVGNRFMLNALSYQLLNKPKAYLCGHIHECNDLYDLDGITISNAAIGNDGKPRLLSL